MLFVLDRDGVINHESDQFIKTPDEWIPIAGSVEAIAALHKAGHVVVVATNQSGVNRKLLSQETLEKIHQKMILAVEEQGGKIDHIYFCPHVPEDQCACRKPLPGMLQKIHDDYGVPYEEMIAIGDSLRDLQAAEAVGCRLVLVNTGNGQKTLQQLNGLMQPMVFPDLMAAVKQFV